MAPAQLSRLQPQITALSSLFNDPAEYIPALSGLLEKYRSEIDISVHGITAHSLIKRLNVSDIVISQLVVSFNHLAMRFPEQAISIADGLWEGEYFEHKQLALHLLSKLPDQYIDIFFNRVSQWSQEQPEAPVYMEMLQIGNASSNIRSHQQWIEILAGWAKSEDFRLIKIGLQALKDLLSVNTTYPLPTILKVVRPIFINPNIKIHTELIELVEGMSDISMNETAAFLISLAIQNQQREMHKFIRKCIPFFPEQAAQKIKEPLLN